MKRTILILCMLSLLCAPVRAAEVGERAPSCILMDAATGTVLYEKEAHTRLAPASVTKVMTLLLVMEALDSGAIGWDDMVTASEHAASKGGSQIYLEPGEQMGMEDMIKSVVVSSANDCATALAEHVAGSESAFVERMNQRAQELGMNDTHFVNCTGLDDGADAGEHLTSAHDIAVMSRELLSHEAIKSYTTIWMDTVRNGAFGLSNTNKLIRFYDGATGLKTGFTSSAGYCLSASAKRDGMELIAAVMHCATSADRFGAAKELLDYGFANYALVSPEAPTQEVAVRLGTEEVLLPVPEAMTPVLINKADKASVRQEVELPEELSAPIEAGQQVGTLHIYAGEALLSDVPLISPRNIPKLSLWALTKALLDGVCFGKKSE